MYLEVRGSHWVSFLITILHTEAGSLTCTQNSPFSDSLTSQMILLLPPHTGGPPCPLGIYVHSGDPNSVLSHLSSFRLDILHGLSSTEMGHSVLMEMSSTGIQTAYPSAIRHQCEVPSCPPHFQMPTSNPCPIKSPRKLQRVRLQLGLLIDQFRTLGS